MCDSSQPHGLQPARLLCPWNFPGKKTRVDCHLLLQGIFLTQELNLGLLHCRQVLYHLSYQQSSLTVPISCVPAEIHELPSNIFRWINLLCPLLVRWCDESESENPCKSSVRKQKLGEISQFHDIYKCWISIFPGRSLSVWWVSYPLSLPHFVNLIKVATSLIGLRCAMSLACFGIWVPVHGS